MSSHCRWFFCHKRGICAVSSKTFMFVNASVTFALRRVYDAPTMSKSQFPCGLRRETLRSSYGFTGIVASTILFNSAQWQIWKNRKSVARRHIAVTSYDPRTGTARWSWGQRRVLDCHLGPKMIVDSCDSREEPARSPHDALAGPIKGKGPPLENHKNIVFLTILVQIMINKFVLPTANKKGSDDRSHGKSESYTCTKPALHDGPSSVRL